MLEDELKERRLRNDEENTLMKHHHDMTRHLEYKHMQVICYSISPTILNKKFRPQNIDLIFKTIHDMRLNHQQIQHTMEIDAQKEHMRSQEQELRYFIVYMVWI